MFIRTGAAASLKFTNSFLRFLYGLWFAKEMTRNFMEYYGALIAYTEEAWASTALEIFVSITLGRQVLTIII